MRAFVSPLPPQPLLTLPAPSCRYKYEFDITTALSQADHSQYDKNGMVPKDKRVSASCWPVEERAAKARGDRTAKTVAHTGAFGYKARAGKPDQAEKTAAERYHDKIEMLTEKAKADNKRWSVNKASQTERYHDKIEKAKADNKRWSEKSIKARAAYAAAKKAKEAEAALAASIGHAAEEESDGGDD
jgi:hypothetical protein